MIGRLNGKIIEKHPPELLLEVNGVSYELIASMNTFYKLSKVGETVTLYTHLIVREDAHTLYAFAELRERVLFRSLIKVNGVGPKMAITILSSIDPDGFMRCIAHEDVATMVKLPGVGKKTAERLVIEMRDRLKHVQEKIVTTSSVNDSVSDAVGALIALGYKTSEATRMVSKITQENLTSEELIRQALQTLA